MASAIGATMRPTASSEPETVPKVAKDAPGVEEVAAMVERLPFEEVQGDDAILNYIFDKGSAFIGAAVHPTDTSDAKDSPKEGSTAAGTDVAGSGGSGEGGGKAVPEPPATASDAHKAKERLAIMEAEKGDLDTALGLLDEVLAVAPEHLSAHNNRAQVLRLLERDEEALEALNNAIAKGEAWFADDASKGFEGSTGWDARRGVLRQAYSQRAMIHKSAGRDDAKAADMAQAGKYGSNVARVIATQQNPYATMCGDAVTHMLAHPSAVDAPSDEELAKLSKKLDAAAAAVAAAEAAT